MLYSFSMAAVYWL